MLRPSGQGSVGIGVTTSLDFVHDTSLSMKNTESTGRTTIMLVLNYMKRSFDEDDFLDNVPLEAAGNAGAWKAWRAYRASSGVKLDEATVSSHYTADHEEWNWDGVWEQRVRQGIDTNVSDSVLFGGASGDDVVCRCSSSFVTCSITLCSLDS